jgi:hypothetical protein
MKLGLTLLLIGIFGVTNAAVLDDFSQPQRWTASATDQVSAALRRDADGSLCLDYDFNGVSGYATMRRELPVAWPAHYQVDVRLKQTGVPNPVQIKWVDAGGENVWWARPPSSQLSTQLAPLRLRPRHLSFAWGPAADKQLRQTQGVEFVVVAGAQGGRGALCVARLELQPREADPAVWPEPRSTREGRQWTLDFQREREFNGLALRWPAQGRPLSYAVQASDDGRRWRTLRRRVDSAGNGLDAIFLPESQARWLRIALPPGRALPSLSLQDAAAWPDLNHVVATLAAEAPRGDVPRAWRQEQNHWTLVGVDGGGQRSALISEDGAIEVGRGGFSVEPVVWRADGRRLSWADVTAKQSLPEGHLPLPQVTWRQGLRQGDLQLEVQAAADGPAAAPQLLARYTLRNLGTQPQTVTLGLALRPWQVNPPQQFLSTPGGVSAVRRLQWDGRDGLRVDERPLLRFSPGAAAVALPFDRGLSLAALQAAPPLRTLDDPQAHASALLRWRVRLAPGQSRQLGFVAPLGAAAAEVEAVDEAALTRRFDAVAEAWRQRLSSIELQGPADTRRLADSLRSALVHLLISRDGPALRPGTRSYARTWVRDGAMMVAALLRLGEVAAARDFVDWFSGQVFASGKVPCCVDERGADPVPENDSHGQYLYAVAEVLRATDDAAWAQRHWGTVQRVTAWMEGLRQSERTAHNRQPERTAFFGLMPPSISHEGYSDRPAYSLWDDFWALRGYKDAVFIARRLGQADAAARWAGWRDEFSAELRAAIAAAQARYGIAFVPGATDRGDFDATSTTIALDPAQAGLPPAWLSATFDRYWLDAQARAAGQRAWADYTPYEWRNVGALVRLGQPQRAHALMAFFFGHQRPPGWNQWAEVVLPDAREPRFLGDMPHAWVSSDFVRSALDLFAYDDENNGRIVLGAGWTADWLRAPRLALRGVQLAQGPLDLSLDRSADGWWLELPQPRPRSERALVLRWPEGLPLPRALYDGRPLAWQGRELTLPPPPLRVQLLPDGAR